MPLLTKNYTVTVEHKLFIEVTQEELDDYSLDFTNPNDVDYEEMFDYFSAKGHNVEMEEEAIDYENNGVTLEYL